MKEQFEQWILDEGLKESTANSYVSAISRLSKHYSQQINEPTDIYQISDLGLLKGIVEDYSKNGRFAAFGKKSNSTYKSAIVKYVEFFTQFQGNENEWDDEEYDGVNFNYEKADDLENQYFSYEQDLKESLCRNITTLFPDYKPYGNGSEGIEYQIEGGKIDVLLEHTETKDLLVIELKAGQASCQVFGQISMYIGALQSRFPARKIQGVIIAGSIDNGLQHATSTTDKIKLKTYAMKIELEKA